MGKGTMAKQDCRRRRRVVFSGHVQGVGFRYRTLGVARRFAVVGFVRNLSDGRVELVAEGESAELDQFVAAVRQEMNELIHGVEDESAPATTEFQEFEIRV